MHLKYRTFIYIWVCLLWCGRLWAQEQRHYVYIQSEKGQPFYVKHKGKLLSSTERGYLIIPQLENGTVPLTVGFPKNEGPEQQFYLKVGKNDQGFLLKKSADAGYTLYNLQTFRELKPDNGEEAPAVAAAAEAPAPPEETTAAASDTAKKEMMGNLQKDLETTFANKATVTGPAKPANGFSSALDKVVVTGEDRNGSIAEAPKEKAKDTVAVADAGDKKAKDTKAPLTAEEQAILSEVMVEERKAAAGEAAAEEAAKAAVVTEETPRKPKNRKKREGDPDFIEFQDDKNQPAATTVAPAVVEETPAPVAEQPERSKKKKRKLFDDTENPPNVITDPSGYGVAAAVPVDAPEKGSRKKKKRGEEEVTGAPEAAAVAGTEVAAGKNSKATDARLINTDCGNIMDEDTFRKVLRKFVAARSDDGMIDVFRKQTRNYCLETVQIKTLAQLMAADDGRYRLLDLAYSKTYDTEKYATLESLLTDTYYKGRFKAMLHK
ncbi:DUF4476 domain-containing protein [Chitinophaga nivalis]|uniref:DUF4476 domain-containing protein n=1 Tax=Chitinophaga nivalis TaxID=2991709 RepID=A0ABT3IXP6_9BACT|nr:DUF4476 domain-containing protein [Chitinophaga nivalis]MCW3461806.1 DUF4476 domain-containing protein [Chitinophaga nivalis]MCW3488500.1 DUF4476 domain-containing protein [Chitinophaga nivalis]